MNHTVIFTSILMLLSSKVNMGCSDHRSEVFNWLYVWYVDPSHTDQDLTVGQHEEFQSRFVACKNLCF